LANEPLRATHAGWKIERMRAKDAERELVATYDQQPAELTAANDEIFLLRLQVVELVRGITGTSQSLITTD
jgi:propanediol dehydratase small subunit